MTKRHLIQLAAASLLTASLIATRGCSNRCGFCYLSTTGLKMPCQMRDPDDVARELASVDLTIVSGLALGVDTALNTIVEACDRISDTARAHRRAFVVEVMGRQCGFLAMRAGIAAEADAILFGEVKKSEDEIVAQLRDRVRFETTAEGMLTVTVTAHDAALAAELGLHRAEAALVALVRAISTSFFIQASLLVLLRIGILLYGLRYAVVDLTGIRRRPVERFFPNGRTILNTSLFRFCPIPGSKISSLESGIAVLLVMRRRR